MFWPFNRRIFEQFNSESSTKRTLEDISSKLLELNSALVEEDNVGIFEHTAADEPRSAAKIKGDVGSLARPLGRKTRWDTNGKLERKVEHKAADEPSSAAKRNETAKGAKVFSATAVGNQHTHSYCRLDYPQIYDVVRYRLQRMRDELEDKNTVQEYVCPNCGKRYNALDAPRLISVEDEYFRCESCNGELVADGDKIASHEVGDGDTILQNLEVLLEPLIEQNNRVKDLRPPEFSSLQAREARAHAHRRALNGESSGDPSKSSHGAYGGTPMPFLGVTKVEVDFKEGKDNGVKSESDTTSRKVLQGMNQTMEQRGEVRQEAKMDGFVAGPDEELLAKKRQVGEKSKRDPIAGDASGTYKVDDLNVEPDATAEEEDEDDNE